MNKKGKQRIEVYSETNQIDWKATWLPLTIWTSFMILYLFIVNSFIVIASSIADDTLKAFTTISTLLLLIRLFPFQFPEFRYKLRLTGVKYE